MQCSDGVTVAWVDNNGNSNKIYEMRNTTAVETKEMEQTTPVYSLTSRVLVEALGDFFFVFIGSLQAYGNQDGVLHAALAHGLCIFLLIGSLGHISGGHFNPAVSLAAALVGQLPALDAVCYVIAQLGGGFLGAIAVRCALSSLQYDQIAGGATIVGQSTWGQALFIEAVLTCLLCIVVLTSAVDTSHNSLAPLIIGCTVLADILAGGIFSGASLNPARSFGSNVVSQFLLNRQLPRGFWTYHPVFYVGPLLGAVFAALIHKCVLSRRSRLLA